MGSKPRSCRICLDAKLEDLVAFQTDSDWAHLFEFCTGLSVTKSNAPQYFCKSCLGKLREFSDFKNLCFKSDVLWQQIIVKNANNEHRKDKSKLKIENLTNDDDHSHFDDGIECDHDDSLNDTKTYESREEKPNQSVDLIDYSDFGDCIKSEDKITNKSKKPQKKETKQPVPGSRRSAKAIKPPAKLTVSNKSPQVPTKDYASLAGIPVKIIRFPKMTENLPAVKNRHTNVMFKKPKLAKSKFSKNINIVNDLKTNISSQNLENSKVYKQAIISRLNVRDLKSQIKKSQKSKPNANITYENIKIVSYVNEVITENIQTKSFKESQEFEGAFCREEDDEKDNQDSDYDPEDDIANKCNKPKGYYGGTKVKVVKYKPGKGIKQKGTTIPNGTKFYCGICKFGPTDSEAIIKQHWNMHIVKEDLCCQFCQFIGRDMADMAAHRYEHISPEYKQIKTCLVCFKMTTAAARVLEFHYRSVHLKKKGGICKLCGHELATLKYLRCHEKGHTRPWICDHCGKNFWNRHSMENHWVTVLAIKKHICEYCGQKFKNKPLLDSHIQSRHVDSKLKCHHCDKTFRTKAILKCHLRSLSGPQNFCETCGKGYTTAGGLKKHKRLHTSEKPFKCDQCQKYFRWKSNLTEHILRQHIKVKSNKCEVCSQTFYLKRDVKRHMSMHTGIRPVKCLFIECDKTFYNRNSLKAHCKSKHRNVDSFTSLCRL